MRRLLRLFGVTLLATIGVLAMGLGVYAQETGFEFVQEEPEQEATAGTDALWQKLTQLLEVLDESVVTTTDDVAGLAQQAAELLLGNEFEAGVIGLVQELAGVEDSQSIDAETVIAAGTDAPEVIALAHLVLAAQALSGAPDTALLLEAGEHVSEADRLLAHLKPASVPLE